MVLILNAFIPAIATHSQPVWKGMKGLVPPGGMLGMVSPPTAIETHNTCGTWTIVVVAPMPRSPPVVWDNI